ncbi:hypothetical protein [Sphingobium boeckii]|uniref:Uncharacterized protein n=1 Tax=Sphingobium boeckii TaxID=1082345 RepID=A0A7W9AFB5_9SPHN|nr:hypothetical protein [Sphingobium boeckii]MBB5684391.1 hypothetical protein [Sphingobium boeckii]
MVSFVKSDLFLRFAGGFAVGAIAMIMFQTPEDATNLLTILKSATGLIA